VEGTNAVTGQKGTPIDLISFHAKGQPKFVDGHVRMGISNQLQNINSAFSAIAKFPTRKHDLAAKHGVNLEGALTWAFEFEDQPYFAGFRVLSRNGIDLPVLNTFRMFSKMSGKRLNLESSSAIPLADIVKTACASSPTFRRSPVSTAKNFPCSSGITTTTTLWAPTPP
jgi:xylan 1,4-beta-xylosidase